MRKPRFRFTSAGWLFGIWYSPGDFFGAEKYARYVWLGPYDSFEEAAFSQRHIGFLRTGQVIT